MIKGWSHIWDYDFELDNYTPEELQKVINEACETNFSLEKIKNIYKHSPKMVKRKELKV